MADVRISVVFEGLQDVQSMLDRATNALEPPSLTESLGVGADVFVQSAFDAAPKETGALAASMHKTQDGNGWVIGPGAEIVYASIQEHGGDIYAKDKPMFFVQNGVEYFAMHVRLEGQHYMEEAFDLGKDMATEAVGQEIDRKI